MQSSSPIKRGAIVLVVAAVVVVLLVKKADRDAAPEAQSMLTGTAVAVEQPAHDAPDSPSSRADPAARDAAPTASLPRLIDLGADKCIPCKKMAPILESLRDEFAGRFDVVFIDVWKNRDAAGPYGIRVIPTQIFFDAEGNELFRHEGFFSRQDILGKWAELGYAFAAPVEQEG